MNEARPSGPAPSPKRQARIFASLWAASRVPCRRGRGSGTSMARVRGSPTSARGKRDALALITGEEGQPFARPVGRGIVGAKDVV